VDLPQTLQIDAWRGKPAEATTAATARQWAAKDRLVRPPSFLAVKAIDLNVWSDTRVGWGIVLPEPPGDHGISRQDLATAEDQPAAIRRLIASRTTPSHVPPIFRYKPDDPDRLRLLRNYATGAHPTIGATVGTGKGAVPQYLLLYGTPAQISWDLQYELNTYNFVGRLDLTEADGLDRYVDALIETGGQKPRADRDRTAIWAVHHHDQDITALMRAAIADRVAASYKGDNDLAPKRAYVNGRDQSATHARLLEALQPSAGKWGTPGLVVTTSHGLTDDSLAPAEQAKALGLPVDHTGAALNVDDLLANWQPDGAIWYAHACCSAGGSDLSVFKGLTSENGEIDAVLKTVTAFTTAAGPCVAPLPRRLLGANKPLQAFVGHVEPTFDWTLRNQVTGQYLTDGIRQALYDELYAGRTIGYALRQWFLRAGMLAAQYDQHRARLSAGENVRGELLYYQLAQRDVRNLVILGDPTATVTRLLA
jgi:hypothetical protein